MAEYKSIYTGEQIDAGIGKAITSLQQETDPIFNASASATITSQDIANWNGKSEFSGSYDDLTDKPELFSGDYDDLTNKPSIPSATSDLTNDSGFITKSVNDLTNYTKTSDLPSDLSDFNNDTGFITNSVNDLVNYYLKNEVYTKDEVTALIGAIQQFHYEVVQELPQTGANNIMYLVPKSTSQTNNVYDEYVYSNGWEKIGDTEIDLTDYVTNTDYATGGKAGVFKTSNTYSATTVDASTGYLLAQHKSYNEYNSLGNNIFIGKGTLENVLNERFSAYTTTANLTTLLAGKQDVIDSTHKLSADLVDDSNSTNKFFSGNYNDLTNKPTIPDELSDLTDDSTHRLVTDTEKTTWNGKQDLLTAGDNITIQNNVISASSGSSAPIYSIKGTQNWGSWNASNPISSSDSSAQYWQEYVNLFLEQRQNEKPYPILYYYNNYENDMSSSRSWGENILFTPYRVGYWGSGYYGILLCGNSISQPTFSNDANLNNIAKKGIIPAILIQFNQTTNAFYKATPYYIYDFKTALDTTQAQTITGIKTFNALPVSSVTPTTANQLVNKSYVDNSISTAVGSINTVLATLTTPSGNGGNE